MITLQKITKTYRLGAQDFTVLKGISLNIREGEFVAIMGQSGSGKSTLMNIIGLLDVPTSGEYIFDQENVEHLKSDEQADIRGHKIGFVFQSYNLLPRMSAVKQVGVPLMYQGVRKSERNERSITALHAVGLGDRLQNRPNELSGGQQQRISIARAMVTNPAIILADEPTGALDSKTGREIMDIFTKLNKEGKTVILITHEKEIADYAQRIIHLSDGNIISSEH
ncbi:ABC transporter ATP-binding protein [Candidatus Peregrinibacteria bacterium]|nr:MAG: ABC transporter ATP-binding protein [Candidatus Peregrinibacteria bacterium]